MKSDYKYGTIEYRLEEAKESIDEAIKLSSKLRAETGSIKKVEKIDKIGRLYASVSNFYKPTWTKFDSNNEDDVKKAVLNARKRLEEERATVEEIHQKNLENIESNKKLMESIINFMELVGIVKKYSTWDYKTSRSTKKTETVHDAGYIQDMRRLITIDDGYSSELIKAKLYSEKIDKYEKEALGKIAENQKIKEKEDSYIRKVAKAIVEGDFFSGFYGYPQAD